MRYGYVLLMGLLLQSTFATAQQDCAIGTTPGSNELMYNDAMMDTLLHLQDYRAFFVGESHTDDFEPRFKFYFIRQLNKEYYVRDVFMEIGHAAAWFYNRYLETGDSTLIAGKRLVYTAGGYMDFWTRLYAYNRSLPDSLKIKIQGIDFERTDIFSLLVAARNKDRPVPLALQGFWAHVVTLAADTTLDWRTDRFEKEVEDLRIVLQQHTDAFKLLYGAHFKDVYQALMNTTPATTAVNPRNKAWRPRFLQVLKDEKITRFAAFFGVAHTHYGNKSSITNVLKEDAVFQGKILHIATLYRHFRAGGANGRFVEYNPGEEALFEKYYNGNCRAVIIKSEQLEGAGYKSESDYVIFASETLTP